MAGRTIGITWKLGLVDRATKPLLTQDRAVRRSIEQTGREWAKQARVASKAAGETASAQRRAATAAREEGRASATAALDVGRLARAQAEALRASQRIVAESARVEQAYRRQGRAAREASASQRAAAAVSKGGGIAAGAAGGALARGGALLGVAGGAAAAVGAVKIYAGFEQQLDKVAAVSGATRKQLGSLEQQAKTLGQQTSFSNREVAGGMIELATAGFRVKEIIKAIPGTLSLAAASGTDLARSAEIQAAALRAFELPAAKAGHVADVLTVAANRSAITLEDLGETMSYVGPVAGRFNQSLEDMAAATAILGNVGIKGSQAGTTLRRGLVSVIRPTEKTRKVLAEAGITTREFSKITEDAHGRLRPMPKILGGLATALKDVSGSTRRKTLAQLFGTEALPGMVTLVDKGEKSISTMSRSMRNARGEADKTAKTMRDNVAGAFDQFTGSVETAATNLVEHFGPALKRGLQGAAGLVTTISNAAPSAFFGVRAGLQGRELEPRRRITRGPGGRVESVDVQQPSKVAQVAQKIGAAARSIGQIAADAGKQLLDAFKPATPFLQNVLLPLLEGIGKGILGGVVGAFRVAVPIIKVVATVLGAIGKAAAPLKPVFRGIGLVVGVVFGGVILKAIAGLGKLGGVFKIVGGVARLLAVPLRLVGTAFGFIGRGILTGIRFLARVNPAVVAVRLAIAKVPAFIVGVIGRATQAARSVARGIVKGFDFVKSVPGRVVGFIEKIGGKIGGLAKSLGSGFIGLGKRIVGFIVDGVRTAIGGIAGVFKSLAPKFDVSVNPLHPHFHLSLGGHRVFRRGGRARRYAGGGLVDAYVSSGEQVIAPGGGVWTVPGPRVAADNVFTQLPVGAAVITGDGQRRMAAGASVAEALASQAPHFAGGGVVPGKYSSTSYGPPWGGIQGTGTTATGVNLHSSPHIYGVAVDPRMIRLGSAVYAWPNPFGYGGSFRAFDTGGAIKGRRVDFYDWRGRKKQLGWGRRDTTVSTNRTHKGRHAAGGSSSSRGSGADATAHVPIILGRSRTRGGLLDDAFGNALSAAREGSTPGRFPFIASLREALSQVQTRRDVTVRGTGDSRSRSSSRGSGWPTSPHGKVIGTPYVGTHRLGNWQSDNAIDIGVPLGSRIMAVRDGRITKTGGSYHGGRSRFDGYQATLNGTVFYTHMRSLGVRVGQRVRKGQVIGRSGAANGVPHLHIGYRPPSHPPGFRAGGIVGRFRAGGTAARRQGLANFKPLLSDLRADRAGSLDNFVAVVDGAFSSRLEKLRKQLVAQVHKGGSAKVVARLQAALSAVDETLGRRVGRILRLVDLDKARSERAAGALDRKLRRQGVDSTSVRGLQAQDELAGRDTIPTAQRAVARLKRAALAARKAGQPQQARAIEGELTQARDDLDEALTARVERWRDLVRQKAQDRLDSASFGVDVAQAMKTGLDTSLRGDARAHGGQNSPGAMLQQADAIRSQIIPSLVAQSDAMKSQFLELSSIGDTAGARQAFLGILTAGNEISSAMQDAADLVAQAQEATKQALFDAAQARVDEATHGESMANLGLARLELEQRLSGAFDGGGQARADFIRQNVIPALNSELVELQRQQAIAQEQGDPVLARQIAEGVAGKQNDLLQAQLDAMEQVADNTDPRKVGGGSLAFDFGGDTLTDSIIAAGNGA